MEAPFDALPDVLLRDLRPDPVKIMRFLERYTPLENYPSELLTSHVDAGIAELRGQPRSMDYITQFVLKTVTDCNLRCQYPCYEYIDDSWRALPAVMSDEVIRSVGQRIGAYADTNNLRTVDVIFHGGEPLFMRQPVEYYKRAIPLLLGEVCLLAPKTDVKLHIQTNGMLLREPILDVFNEHKVSVGVSMDGPAQVHDALRKTRAGRGSHERVLAGLQLLNSPAYRHLIRSLLCVVNIDSDPREVDDFLTQHAPPGAYIDYLLPYANHDQPPRRPKDPTRDSATPYADWLLPICIRRILGGTAPQVRIVTSMIRLSLGGTSLTEAIGPYTGGDVVIRTDGSYELLDALKATGGSVATDMSVATHSIESVAQLLRRNHLLGKKSVADACTVCPVLDICGGGHIASRFSAERGFNNPSVYCADLLKLSQEIQKATLHHARYGMVRILEKEGVPPVPPASKCAAC
ncbi:MAG TPA: radical SAM protein [Candidatus Saccharimonadales bacterium]|nr:radical SAM protein [Candidatus Saccharimonadales bacterium]